MNVGWSVAPRPASAALRPCLFGSQSIIQGKMVGTAIYYIKTYALSKNFPPGRGVESRDEESGAGERDRRGASLEEAPAGDFNGERISRRARATQPRAPCLDLRSLELWCA